MASEFLETKILAYPCGHYELEVETERAKREADDAVVRLYDAGISGMYKHATLESFIPSKGTEAALQAAKAFAQSTNAKGYGMVLYSQGNGAGKTHMARAILHAVIMSGGNGLWVRHCDMTHEMKRAYNRAGLLVVDDMWKRATKTSAELLYDVLDQRATRKLPTVVTTNVTQRQAEMIVGDEHTHVINGVYSRLSQMQVVEMNAADYRPKLQTQGNA